MTKFLTKFMKDERGVSAIEYAILAGAIGAIVTTVFSDTGSFATAMSAKLAAALT
ncbi:MAG: Flp family type IVb pilin [Sneathiella sp.]|nr:Flp family type IVb pilin [Sneathiella sp.]